MPSDKGSICNIMVRFIMNMASIGGITYIMYPSATATLTLLVHIDTHSISVHVMCTYKVDNQTW